MRAKRALIDVWKSGVSRTARLSKREFIFSQKCVVWDLNGCLTRGTLLGCDWSIYVLVAAAAFQHTSGAAERQTRFLSSSGTDECYWSRQTVSRRPPITVNASGLRDKTYTAEL
ncbi:hypothetical protein Y032_0461g1879 [Ancylostoma ceylanicum]|uniref:Uncharacterized protein n=1 Tax=Ancylostoma ceylanicum TaxID=53326 RepID=A0A016WZI3_9BILA|nr:hypothetical protein Y032_0461g1879 [Ancylostoma ceylanicum]